MNTESKIEAFRQSWELLRSEIGKVMVGHTEIVEGTLIAVLAGGHVLLEGVPGLGKTLLVRTLGEVLDLSFSRIQFTPDLMPADILGTNLVVENPDGRRESEDERRRETDGDDDEQVREVELHGAPPSLGTRPCYARGPL